MPLLAPVTTMTFPSMFVLMTFSLLPCEELANYSIGEPETL